MHYCRLGVVILCFLLLTGIASAQATVDISRWLIGGGGGLSTGGDTISLRSTMGEPIAGVASSGDCAVGGGFWNGSNSGSSFLPVVLRPSNQISNVYITNNTGGELTYTVFNTPEGDRGCRVPAGAVGQYCTSFTSGTYSWRADSICGAPATGTRYFPPGDVRPTPFYCLGRQ